MKISIITVSLNAASVIRGALDSLRHQTHRDMELIVVDGGSTDGTLDLLTGEYADLRPDLVSEPDKGIYDAMNKGLARATGDVVFFLNADDRLHDGAVLAAVAAAFEADRDLRLLYGDVVYVRPDGTELRSFGHVTRANLIFGDLCHQAVFARRLLFEEIGSFDMRFRINADYDWLLRVFRSPAKLCYVNRPVAFFTTGGMHARHWDALVTERRQVRRQYVSEPGLVVGAFAYRVADRLRREWARLLGSRVQRIAGR